MADITQKLPFEMLAEILVYTHAQDILRSKQVNHAFRNAILASPLLQHMINLFTTGLEYNVAAGVSLDDSQKALLQYRSSLDLVHPTEERTVKTLQPEHESLMAAAGGVLAVVSGSVQVQLSTLGPASRGMSRKEWEIPLPVANPSRHDFCPSADVIAFLEQVGSESINIHVRTLSDGGEHPAALVPVIHHPRAGSGADVLSITSSRLALAPRARGTPSLVVWDWRSAQVLLELEDGRRCLKVEFIDDYRLLGFLEPTSDAPPSLFLMDTENIVGMTPVQTVFHLPSHLRYSEVQPFLMEGSAHRPSPAMSLVPFRCDPAQRIVILHVPSPCWSIFRVGALLELLKSRGGSQVGWDEWKNRVAIPFLNLDYRGTIHVWASGCRFFSAYSMDHGEGAQLEVHDFSLYGHTRYLREQINQEFGGLRYLSSTGKIGHLPWKLRGPTGVYCSHDTAVFSRGDTESGQREMLIWTF